VARKFPLSSVTIARQASGQEVQLAPSPAVAQALDDKALEPILMRGNGRGSVVDITA